MRAGRPRRARHMTRERRRCARCASAALRALTLGTATTLFATTCAPAGAIGRALSKQAWCTRRSGAKARETAPAPRRAATEVAWRLEAVTLRPAKGARCQCHGSGGEGTDSKRPIQPHRCAASCSWDLGIIGSIAHCGHSGDLQVNGGADRHMLSSAAPQQSRKAGHTLKALWHVNHASHARAGRAGRVCRPGYALRYACARVTSRVCKLPGRQRLCRRPQTAARMRQTRCYPCRRAGRPGSPPTAATGLSGWAPSRCCWSLLHVRQAFAER